MIDKEDLSRLKRGSDKSSEMKSHLLLERAKTFLETVSLTRGKISEDYKQVAYLSVISVPDL